VIAHGFEEEKKEDADLQANSGWQMPPIMAGRHANPNLNVVAP